MVSQIKLRKIKIKHIYKTLKLSTGNDNVADELSYYLLVLHLNMIRMTMHEDIWSSLHIMWLCSSRNMKLQKSRTVTINLFVIADLWSFIW